MRYLALICDYDGTLARGGHLSEAVAQSLQRVRDSGRKLLLITGRELPDLLTVLPAISLFDRVVAENGAVLYRPFTQEEKWLAAPPPPAFLQALREQGVQPLSQGRVIVSTRHPQETVVLEVIRKMGLDLIVSFNKGAVMLLPSGVNKAAGLHVALEELGLSADHVVGIGDGENDLPLLKACGLSVAVANALPILKEQADVVTIQENGEGVQEIIEKLLFNDLHDVAALP